MSKSVATKVLVDQMSRARGVIEIARPKHYLKNLFILAPMIIYSDYSSISAVVVAFAAFCLISSAIYILNDYFDAFYDATHPEKMHRPIPSGRLSEREALILFSAFLSIFVVLTMFFAPTVTFWGLVYLVINVFYSAALKDVAIVDVIIVSSGFVIRYLVGLSMISEGYNDRLILPIFILSVGLATGKRLAKLMKRADAGDRKTIRIPKFYTADRLSGILLFLANASIFFGAWILARGGSSPLLKSITSIDAFIIGLCAVVVISRVTFLIIGKALEPSTAFSKDLMLLSIVSFMTLYLIL